ncbi:hypothetical protein SprV_0702254100 [Sparganum proliferum]
MPKSKPKHSGRREAASSPSPSIEPVGMSQGPVSPPKPQDGPPTTVVAAQRPCPQPLHMSGNKINTMRTVDIPPYDGTESFTVWLRRAKFYLREVSEADRPWTLLKALAPKLLDKALDARLDADLTFDMLCQRLANLFSHTYSFGDAMEQLQQRRLKQDETLNQLVEDLERLTTVAFPSLGSADKDNTVLYYFIKALPTSDLSRSLLLQPPENVQEAVTRAERYLRLCPPTSRPLSPEDTHVRDGHHTPAGRAGSRWFSTLDLKSGYWQVEVEPADRQKTAFILPQGLYEFETMPFGLCNAAATFQRLMQVVLSHLYPRQCLIYLDDVIVFGKTITQHNDNLRAVLLALREAGLTLNPQKCQFLREKVNYLGHEVSPSGFKVSAEKAGAILTWPTPNSTTEVRSFIGLASYYRRFIRDFAGIARPLHRLTEKGREFRWTDECQAAFDELRTRLSRAPILMLPNTTETAPPFVLDTDASAFAMGGVLSQTDDNGLERVICFASKTLTKPQRNYCTYRRELLAIVTFVKQFRPYLLGKPFVIRSDHKALQWLQNTKDAEGQLARWQEMLQEYHFTCTYRPGKQHGNADALSRRPTTPAAHDDDRPIGEINAIYATEPARHHWAIAQSTDPDTAVIYDHLLNRLHRPTGDELRGSSEEAHILRRQWPRLHIDEDILLIKDESTETNRVVVPGSLVEVVLTNLHNELGHVGQAKTEAATRQRFWWPHLREHVATFCNTCTTCSKFMAPRQLPRAPLQPMHTSFPFQRLGLDIIGPLPFTTTGHRFILVMVDYFTKWAEAVPLLRQDAVSLTNAIFNNWICRFGVPLSIHSDCGANFDSKLLQEVCDLLDIYKTRTTPAHPEGNGLVERTNRRQFRLPADSRFPQPAASEYAPDSYVWQLQDLLRSTYTLARNHLGAAAERQKTYFDRQVHGNPYQLGDLVWRFRPVPPLGTAAKFFHPWEGPFVVVDVIHPTTYVLRDASRPDGPNFTTHFDKLKPYRGQLPTATADVTPIIPPHLVPTPVVEETVDMTRPDSPADRAPSEEGGM